MKRGIVFCVVLIAAFALLMGGCSKKSDTSGPKLVYWSMWNEAEPQGQAISRAAAAFTRETGVQMEINFNGREIRQTLQPALDAGETIDIFDEDINRVIETWGNYLLPLDSYYGQSYSTTGGQPYSSVVHKAMVDLVRDVGGGSLKAVPYQPFAFIMQYNKDLFNQAGVTSLPKTWDEMLDVCAKLRAAGVAGFTVDDAYMACLFGYTIDRIAGLDASRRMVQNNDFSHPSVLRFGQIWENMARNGYILQTAAGNIWPSGQVNDFATGRAAMYLNGTWLPNEIKGNAPNMNWGQFSFPAIDGAGDGIEANNYGSQVFGVNKNTKFPEEAFKFCVWLTTGEWDSTLARESLGIPMASNSQWPPQLAEAKAVVDATTKWLPWSVHFQDDSSIDAKIKENFSRLISGEYNAQQFAAAMAR